MRQTGGFAVGIVEFHCKVGIVALFDKDKSVGTNAKTPVAKPCYLFARQVVLSVEVVDDDEIVACTLIFIEFQSHDSMFSVVFCAVSFL